MKMFLMNLLLLLCVGSLSAADLGTVYWEWDRLQDVNFSSSNRYAPVQYTDSIDYNVVLTTTYSYIGGQLWEWPATNGHTYCDRYKVTLNPGETLFVTVNFEKYSKRVMAYAFSPLTTARKAGDNVIKEDGVGCGVVAQKGTFTVDYNSSYPTFYVYVGKNESTVEKFSTSYSIKFQISKGSSPTTSKKPDLYFDYMGAKSSFSENEVIDVKMRVKNKGTTFSEDTTVKVTLGNQSKTLQLIGMGMNSSISQSLKCSFNAKDVGVGDVIIKAEINPNRNISELSTTNNIATQKITIYPATPVDEIRYVYSGETIRGIVVNSNEDLIIDGGIVEVATVNSEGYIGVKNKGMLNDSSVNIGGLISVLNGGIANNISVTTDPKNYDYLYMREGLGVSEGGSVEKISLNSGLLRSYGFISDVDIYTNGEVEVKGGSVTNTRIHSGGEMTVSRGSAVSNTIINSGGILKVHENYSDQTKTTICQGITVNAGGQLMIYGTVPVRDITIMTGGVLNGFTCAEDYYIEKAPISYLNMVLQEEDSALVEANQIAINTLVKDNAALIVAESGLACNTTLQDNAKLYLSGGKVAGYLRINSTSEDSYTGTVVSVDEEDKGTIDFTVSDHTANGEALITNWNLIKNPHLATYTITLNPNQASGVYVLATGVTNFTNTLAVYDAVGAKQGNIAVNGTCTFGNLSCKLKKEDGRLTLTVSKLTPFDFTITNGNATITGYDGTIPTTLNIPATIASYPVTAIAANAFKGNKKITSVKLPTSLKEIGASAFTGCTNLKTVNFPSALTTIRQHAFSSTGITGLVTLPASLTTLEYAAFFKCPNITGATIRNCTKLTVIGEAAFRECANFTAVSLPDSLTTIGARAFYLNAKLARVTIVSNASKIATIGDYAFSGCAALATFDFAKTKALKSIKQHAFSNSGLTTFTLPATVTAVEYAAFYRCKKLATATLSSATSLTALGEAAFRECPIFTATSLPRSLKTIGARAFRDCPKLVRVTINKENSQLATIGDEAFMNCTKLTNITFPNKLVTIKTKAFYATGLNQQLILPATLTSLGTSTFAKCPNLKLVTLINCSKLKVLGEDVFRECPNFTAISLPNALTTIGVRAFYLNAKLNRVTLGGTAAKLNIIGAHAFYGCKALKSFDFAKTTALKNIRSYAFAGSALTGYITFPASLETLEFAAFYRCLNLGTVTLSGCGKLVALGDAAFRECTSLTALSLPRSLKTIGARAFYGCTKLNRVTIHATLANLTTIGESAFYNCKALKTFTMPSTVTTVRANAFAGCTTKITFAGPSPTTIGAGAFPSGTVLPKTALPQPFTSEVVEGTIMITGLMDADTVGSIVIPESINGKPVTIIACDAFRGCYGVETVMIPATVTAIGDGAFVDCGVETLIFEGLPPEIVYSDDGRNLGVIADRVEIVTPAAYADAWQQVL